MIAGKECIGLRSNFVRIQGAMTGAKPACNRHCNAKAGQKDKQAGMFFDRNYLIRLFRQRVAIAIPRGPRSPVAARLYHITIRPFLVFCARFSPLIDLSKPSLGAPLSRAALYSTPLKSRPGERRSQWASTHFHVRESSVAVFRAAPFVVITLPSVGTVHLSPNKKIRPAEAGQKDKQAGMFFDRNHLKNDHREDRESVGKERQGIF